jgi:hypothetical protein
VIAYSRPFWPLFLHVFGAMALFGAILAVLILSIAAWGRPDSRFLHRATFAAALVAVPAYVVMRAGAEWIYSKEGWGTGGAKDPTWIGIGYGVADIGLLVLLVLLGVSYWWSRSGRPFAGRIVTVLSLLLVAALGVAWLAMSGKWS